MVFFLKNLLKGWSKGSIVEVYLIFKWKGKRLSGFKTTKNDINNVHTPIAFKPSMQDDSSISPAIEISDGMNA